MAKNPFITVVIPAYNEEKLIGRCVKAVLNQTYPRENYEVIVVDNNSTDKTGKIAKSLGAKVLFYDEAQGFAHAKQFGSIHTSADIIAYTDADSIPSPHWLSSIAKIMKNQKYQCIGGTILEVEGNFFISSLFSLYDSFAHINQRFGVSLIWSPNMAVRKSAFDTIGGWNLNMKTSDDWDFIFRVQKKFGKKSTLYTPNLLVKTSVRRQRKFLSMLSYSGIGVFNYFAIFVFSKPVRFGKITNIR